MLAAYRRTSQTHRLLPLTSLAADLPAAAEPSARYDGGRQPNWAVIGVLALLHAAGFYALVKLDVIPLAKAGPKPIVVELIETPEMAPPPPEPAQPTPPEQPAPVTVAPTPLVMAPVTAPPPIAVAPPPAVNVPAAPAAKAAPVTPPDFSADYLKNPAPRYPVESRRLKEQGTVTVKVLVSPEGTVQDLKLAESSGHSRLDKAALAAIRNWRFAPAKQAGQPVATWVIVPIPFVLQG